MATPNILVVDSDEGFGTMLKEGLEGSGYYNATWFDNGREALKAVMKTSPDLVIIDAAIRDVPPVKLVRAIQKNKDGTKIMMIPLIGQHLSEQVQQKLKIDGVLTKPFFVGDLPQLIDKALGIEGRQPAAAPPPAASAQAESKPTNDSAPNATAPPLPPLTPIANVSPETVSYIRANETEIVKILSDLNGDVRAEAILLIVGQELIAYSGLLGRDQCVKLTSLVAQSSQAASEAAKFLGEKKGRFAQSSHEGSEYRLYTLSLEEGILLSLALSSNVPLGMIRHQCRQVADQLMSYIN